jgi:phasin
MTQYQVPNEMRELANKSVEQTRKAFEGFFEAAQKATHDTQSSSSSMQEQAKTGMGNMMQQAEKNVQASLEYAQRLVLAKSVEELAAIQNEFIRSQMFNFNEQAKAMGENIQEAMRKAAK